MCEVLPHYVHDYGKQIYLLWTSMKIVKVTKRKIPLYTMLLLQVYCMMTIFVNYNKMPEFLTTILLHNCKIHEAWITH